MDNNEFTVRFGLAVLSLALGVQMMAHAQQPQHAQQGQTPHAPITFFVTSAGPGKGANFGGLQGDDIALILHTMHW